MARDAEKKPVLTSPWKIGALVALLLMMTGIGVAYYVVDVYDVTFSWLRPSENFPGFSLDSFSFFREMYPLVAAVIGLSLLSYFVVASAVRRYRFYLSSGQDYRKMVSLADSIDDLTNPAQIAKLSDFPELQHVLRNYGDRIREISSALEEKERESKSIDLEMEIDSLLRGEPVDEANIEGRWWAPLFRRVHEYVEASAHAGNEHDGTADETRRVAGRVLLATGKALEAIGGANGDLDGIAGAAGELVGVSSRHGDGPANDACFDRMEETVRHIEQGGAALGEFSEETNGIALNLALMAAKGSVDEHELAAFAEKARATAERFRRLGDTFSGIRRELFDAIRMARGGGGADAAASGEDVATIGRRIDECGRKLRDRVTAVTGEMEEINRFVKEWMGEQVEDERPATQMTDDGWDGDERLDVVDYGAGDPEVAGDGDLVIDHGESWQNVGEFASMFAGNDEPRRGDAFGSGEETRPSAETPETEAVEAEQPVFEEPAADEAASIDPVTFNEISLGRGGRPAEPVSASPDPVQPTAAPAPEASPARESVQRREPALAQETAAPADQAQVSGEQSDTGEGWMQMPDREPVRVDVEPDSGCVRDVPVAEKPASGQAGEAMTPAADEGAAESDEPVYDLFELGAVEYVEETQTQR